MPEQNIHRMEAAQTRLDNSWIQIHRVPSPFPPVVIDHLPPDGRSLHQRRIEPVSSTSSATTTMNYNKVPMMTRNHHHHHRGGDPVATTTAIGHQAIAGPSRRVPPPPPPRTGVVAHRSSLGGGVPPIKTVTAASASTSSSPSSAGRMHLIKASNKEEQQLLPVITASSSSSIPAATNSNSSSGYLETRYAYSVNGILGSAAQASAAAAFFARASQKLNLASPHRRKRHGSSDGDGSPASSVTGSPAHRQHQRHHFATDFCALLRRNPPPPPARLLHRLGTREKAGVGKVRVMLRISGDPSSGFLNVDKKRKQLTLQEPSTTDHHHPAGAEDRRVGVSAPKMFAFDGLFTQEDSQADVASSVLSDIVTAVINGSDGCVFCFGHAQLGKTSTMVGTCSTDESSAAPGPGLIPTAISWLFRGIAEQKSKTGARFSVRVSAVEVAGPSELLRDLLAPHATESEESPGVYLRDDPLLGTQLQNQSELRAPTAEKAAFYLDAALAARTDSASPDARYSHLLYTLHVYQYSVDRTPGKGPTMSNGNGAGVAGGRSRLHLLDLGSCQTIRSASAATSNAMTLSGLGNVLVALFNGQRHLPHREHKITQVLRECLGSLTCQAALVAHIANTSAYSETLSTVQMASRVHRMRRRRVKQYNGGSGGSGSGGSSEDSSRLGNGGLSRSSGGESGGSTSADPSSSEQSCDTVIYVGPIDDATDGEHPPVYLPSLNSGDQRCSMSRALRGSSVEHQPKKASSPHVQRKSVPTKCETVASSGHSSSEEQWIDGPRFNKTRISAARMQVVRHQREMWVDGPGSSNPSVAPTSTVSSAGTQQGYGFMDHHKQGMIRQWVETQSAQQLRLAGASSGSVAQDGATPVKTLTVFKTCPDEEEEETVVHQPESKPSTRSSPARIIRPNKTAASAAAGNQDGSCNVAVKSTEPEESVQKHPTPSPVVVEEKLLNNALSDQSGTMMTAALTLEQLYSQCEQLADSLCRQDEDGVVHSTDEEASDDLSAALDVTSEQVSVSCDSWRRVRQHNTIHEESDEASSSGGGGLLPMNGRGGDYSPEYIEVEEPDEPVPTQDSCLQVTEEDIARSMMEDDDDQDEQHPLRALSTDNLTVISHFTGETYSQGTASEWEPINSIFDPITGGLHNDFYQTQLNQLAKLHQQVYPSEGGENNAANGDLHPTPLSILTAPNIGSFKDLPLLSQDWSNPLNRNGNIAKDARKTLVASTIGLELERELGIQDAFVAHQSKQERTQLSSLRHPDGASDPHIDQLENNVHTGEKINGVQELPVEIKPIFNNITMTTVPVDPEVIKPVKTPKLSRFFGGGKSKRSTATSTSSASGGSPIMLPKSAKNSPKLDKKNSNKKVLNSPAKTSSKSPCRTLVDSVQVSSPIPPSPKSSKSGSSGTKKSSSKSPKRDPTKANWPELTKNSGKRDVKSYGFSYEGIHHHQQQQTVNVTSSLCPSEGYESGGSDPGNNVHLSSPIKMLNNRHHHQQQRRPVLMPSIGELPRNKTFSSSGTSTSGSGGSGGHYESSGYESVVRDSECSSLGSSSQDSDRGMSGGEVLPNKMALTVIPGKQSTPIGHSSSCAIL